VSVVGLGQPGAQVEVRDGGRVIATTTVGADGSWSATVPAPDRGGVYRVTAVQRVQGQDTDSVDLGIDYGTAVRITSPGDGYHTNPVFSRVRIAGVAEAGSIVRVGERGGAPDGFGRVVVGADGRWSVTTPALGVGEHVVVATSTSKGANTTTSEVRLVVDDH
jgi:2-polyprenyl-6-methoxyphenol hydroxylase-like FAD-dependent oxidoreductase